MKSCCAGAAEEDRNRRPADDPGPSDKGGGDQTLRGTKQSESYCNNTMLSYKILLPSFHGFSPRLKSKAGMSVCFQASAQREVEESVQVFSELVRSIQRTQAELVVSIEEKQRQTERWANDFIAELEQEIANLKSRKTDLENVARTDHIHFLKVRQLIVSKANFVF